MYREGVCFRKDSGFQCTHENVSIGRCLFVPTAEPDVKFIVESENIFVENEFQKLFEPTGLRTPKALFLPSSVGMLVYTEETSRVQRTQSLGKATITCLHTYHTTDFKP